MLTKKDKLERLKMADYLDPSGKLRVAMETLFTVPEKDWQKPETREKLEEAIEAKNSDIIGTENQKLEN